MRVPCRSRLSLAVEACSRRVGSLPATRSRRARRGLPRSWPALRLGASLLGASLLGALLLGASGCRMAEPGLYPHDPSPGLEENRVLLVLSDDLVASMSHAEVRARRDEALAEARTSVGGRVIDEARKDSIRRHVVLTGMSAEEVIWCFEAQPVSVREQGPPGGHTLLWDPRGRAAGNRYWVRFDGWGVAISAGKY